MINNKIIFMHNFYKEDKFIVRFFLRYFLHKNFLINKKDNKPKFVKGPDILMSVVKKINKKVNLSFLLSGPNRQWVMNEFKNNNIAYKHFNYNYFETIKLYQEIDFLIVTSRIEGGPRSVMEAVHANVPVISTNVGIIKDFFTNKKNFILIDENNIEKSVEEILNIIRDKNLRKEIISSANNIKNNFKIDDKIHRYKKIYSILKK